MASHRFACFGSLLESWRRRSSARVWAVGALVAFGPGLASAQLTAAIAANRTSGLAPLAVRFDATGSDCNGNGTASEWNGDLEECSYSWDFGDPTSPPYAYGAAARAGQAPSANRSSGFVAGHVFENPGTHTLTLTIRNPSGQTATRTQTVNVSSFAGTTYCVRASNSGDFAGCPSGATQITQSNFNTALSTCGATSGSRRCLFRRGDSFTAGSTSNLGNGPGLIGAFGSGARPRIAGSGVAIGGGSDWRLADLDFDGTTVDGASHRLLYRSRIRNAGHGYIWWGTGFSNIYLVRSTIENVSDYGYYVLAQNQLVLGSAIINSGSGGGHNVRTGNAGRSVFASSDFGPAGAGHVFKAVGEGQNGATAQYTIWRDNVILKSNAGYPWAFTLAPQGPGADDFAGGMAKVLVEGNYFTRATAGTTVSVLALLVRDIKDLTIRNNVCDMTQRYQTCMNLTTGTSGYGPITNATVMNNTAAWASGAGPDESEVVFRISGGLSNVRVANNLFYHGVSWGPAAVSCGSCSLNSSNLKISTNPFVSTSFSSPWSMRLASGSAPVGAGVAAPAAFFDISGALRTGSHDVGAWELATATPPPPPVLLP